VRQATEHIPDRSKRLIVLRFSALGDVALMVPVLMAFLETYPDYSVTLVTRPRFSPIFNKIEGVNVLEARLEGAHKGIIGLFRLHRSIRKLEPEAIVDLHNVLRTKVLRLFFSAKTIGIKAIDKGRSEKRALTRSSKKIYKPLKHTSKRYKEVFEGLGYSFNLKSTHILPKGTMPNNIVDRGQLGGKLIGIAPFAAHKGKMYSLTRLEKVIKALNDHLDCTILCFGGGDKEKSAIAHWSSQYPNCINLIGQVSFDEELKVISNLDLMLSMDSGNGHLAAIFGVPTLTLWGITHPFAGFAPYGQPEEHRLLADRTRFPQIPTSIYGNTYPEGYEEAINTISEEEIISRILAIIDQNA